MKQINFNKSELMSLKEKIKMLKIKFIKNIKLTKNKNLNNNKINSNIIGDSNIYRLHYLDFNIYDNRFVNDENKYGIFDIAFKPFELPSNMEREEAFKVLSFLSDYIVREINVEENSFQLVKFLDSILHLENLGFNRNIEILKDDSIIDLFTIIGRTSKLKYTVYYNKYFEWYIPNTTYEEILSIYQKYNKEFILPVFAHAPTYPIFKVDTSLVFKK